MDHQEHNPFNDNNIFIYLTMYSAHLLMKEGNVLFNNVFKTFCLQREKKQAAAILK